MSYKKKVVFICHIKKNYVFICHLILNDIYKRNFLMLSLYLSLSLSLSLSVSFSLSLFFSLSRSLSLSLSHTLSLSPKRLSISRSISGKSPACSHTTPHTWHSRHRSCRSRGQTLLKPASNECSKEFIWLKEIILRIYLRILLTTAIVWKKSASNVYSKEFILLRKVIFRIYLRILLELRQMYAAKNFLSADDKCRPKFSFSRRNLLLASQKFLSLNDKCQKMSFSTHWHVSSPHVDTCIDSSRAHWTKPQKYNYVLHTPTLGHRHCVIEKQVGHVLTLPTTLVGHTNP